MLACADRTVIDRFVESSASRARDLARLGDVVSELVVHRVVDLIGQLSSACAYIRRRADLAKIGK